MTRLDALKALLALPDPDGMTRTHAYIYPTADRWKISTSYVFKILRGIERERRTA
jgi:hypothetical protein